MYENQKSQLPLVIVQGEKPAFFGRNWLEKIKLDWGEIFTVEKPNPADRLIRNIFQGLRVYISGRPQVPVLQLCIM